MAISCDIIVAKFTVLPHSPITLAQKPKAPGAVFSHSFNQYAVKKQNDSSVKTTQ
jgi:hypothetical protein